MNYSKQRELILAIVKNTKVHPTAEWVYQEAKKEMPSIGIATVYRNLNALAERGEFKRITVAGGTDRFDGDLHEHDHVECTCCGRLIDLEPVSETEITKLREMMRRTFAVQDESTSLSTVLFKGLCDNCREQKHDIN